MPGLSGPDPQGRNVHTFPRALLGALMDRESHARLRHRALHGMTEYKPSISKVYAN